MTRATVQREQLKIDRMTKERDRERSRVNERKRKIYRESDKA